MFIETLDIEVLCSSGGETNSLTLHQPYIALRWSAQPAVGREVYRHLAPLEPKLQ